jgi:hypothetical protein
LFQSLTIKKVLRLPELTLRHLLFMSQKGRKSQKSLIIQALALFCSICGKIGQKMETLYKKSIRHLLCGTQMKMPRPGATSA